MKTKDVKIVAVSMSDGVPAWKKVAELLKNYYIIVDKTVYSQEEVAVYILEKITIS